MNHTRDEGAGTHEFTIADSGDVIRVWYPSEFTDDQLSAALETLVTHVRKKRTTGFGMLTDFSRITASRASRRRLIADFFDKNHDEFEKRCHGMAFVVSSPELRGALTAIFWVKTPPCPIEIFEQRIAAEAWLTKRKTLFLEKRGR